MISMNGVRFNMSTDEFLKYAELGCLDDVKVPDRFKDSLDYMMQMDANRHHASGYDLGFAEGSNKDDGEAKAEEMQELINSIDSILSGYR